MVVREGRDTDTAPALTRVVVVTTTECCPAVVALRSMVLDFEFVVAKDEFTYAETLHRYWQMGDNFINVEHDIVPYPGALEALDECEKNWCGYDYPIGYGGLFGACFQSALGCVKFGKQLMRDYPDLSEQWLGTPWNSLDGAIFRSLAGKVDGAPVRGSRWTDWAWHEHKPAVAHLTPLKKLDDTRAGC